MAGKDISVKKYVVRLSAGEREHFQALIRKGNGPAGRLLKARILLKADVSDSGEGWSDSRIIAALDTSASMIYRVRKQLVEEGFEAVLSKPRRSAWLPSRRRKSPAPVASCAACGATLLRGPLRPVACAPSIRWVQGLDDPAIAPPFAGIGDIGLQ